MNQSALKIHIFYCSNSFEPDQLTTGFGKIVDVELKMIGMPCSGKIDVPYLMKAFETGADGAAIVTCKINECQHLEGNLRAQKRAESVEAMLEEIGYGKGRMAVITLNEKGVESTISEIRDFVEKVGKLPKPMAA
jgi:coenzyme F420-reducing hydrogenase delta subunit